MLLIQYFSNFIVIARLMAIKTNTIVLMIFQYTTFYFIARKVCTTLEHFIWNIDPTILHLGPLQLRWYGLLFVGSFFLGLMILQKYIQEKTEILLCLITY